MPQKEKIMKMNAALSCVLGLLILGKGSSVSADTIFFTDRTAWDAAAGHVITETYESYPWNRPGGVLLGSVSLGDYDYVHEVGELYGSNSAVVTYDAAYLSGKYLEWQSGSP